MAGTRGIAKLKGEQIRPASLKDIHFDPNNKVNEDKLNINWGNHKEILESTKIDVFVQVNNKVVSGVSSIDISAELSGFTESTGLNNEGIVTGTKVPLRKAGTEDFPYIDEDGDTVYGKITFNNTSSKFFIEFFSLVNGIESPYMFPAANPTDFKIDFKYIRRTNLAVIPVDALLQGGTSFVEGATDAKAYMNLEQLKNDIYGVIGTLDGDGKANLSKSITQQIADEASARFDADIKILDDLAAQSGANLVGVQTDTNYSGTTVQAVLEEIAERISEVETGGGAEVEETHTRSTTTTNSYFQSGTFTTITERIENIETKSDEVLGNHQGRITKIETENDRFVFEAVGGETSVTIPGGKLARPNTLFISLNGAIQAPGINYAETVDGSGKITGVSFAPEVLSAGDVVFIWFKLAS